MNDERLGLWKDSDIGVEKLFFVGDEEDYNGGYSAWKECLSTKYDMHLPRGR